MTLLLTLAGQVEARGARIPGIPSAERGISPACHVVVGLFIIIAAYVLNIVFCIIAAVKANKGEWYKYPLTIPFVS